MKAEAEGRTAAENAARIRAALQNLRGRIPELKELHVGSEVLPSSTESAELVLVTRHDDAAGLAAYAAHPEHQVVLAILKETTSSRRAIDFMD
jgi:hypothetical protein